MASSFLPMFPLGTPLLPGGVLPLHIFEERYRIMIADCLAASRHEFGVVLIERGREVGGGDMRSMCGTVAQIVDSHEFPDGRWAVLAVGQRRIRVTQWLADDPYPLANVEEWPDEPENISDISQRIRFLVGRLQSIYQLAAQLGEDLGEIPEHLDQSPYLASFQLCSLAPVGSADRQRLLLSSRPSVRLDLLSRALDDVEAAFQFRLQPD